MFISLHSSKLLELSEDKIKKLVFDFESKPSIAAVDGFYYQMQVTFARKFCIFLKTVKIDGFCFFELTINSKYT